MRRVETAVPYPLACQRVLSALADGGMARPSALAAVIWPDTRFRSKQGAAWAARGILTRMQAEGLVFYKVTMTDEGWAKREG